MIDSCSVTGVTSNPTIFANAIGASDHYDHQLRAATDAGITDPQELFFDLALEDVRRAADLLLNTHRASNGRDGFVSMECTPDLAHDASGTTTQAISLWERLARPNVLIKVPATDAGILAIEELTVLGLNVNVTLLFSVARYEEAAEAYMRGIERRLATGASVAHVTSVASFFVSRVDTKVDALLPPGSELRGRVAVANAQRAYLRYAEIVGSRRWRTLEAAGARRQRPLWASTATKDPAYSDLLYVEGLILPGTINTMPITTLSAFSSHGRATHAVADSAAGGSRCRRPRPGPGRDHRGPRARRRAGLQRLLQPAAHAHRIDGPRARLSPRIARLRALGSPPASRQDPGPSRSCTAPHQFVRLAQPLNRPRRTVQVGRRFNSCEMTSDHRALARPKTETTAPEVG